MSLDKQLCTIRRPVVVVDAAGGEGPPAPNDPENAANWTIEAQGVPATLNLRRMRSQQGVRLESVGAGGGPGLQVEYEPFVTFDKDDYPNGFPAIHVQDQIVWADGSQWTAQTIQGPPFHTQWLQVRVEAITQGAQ